MVHAEHFGRLDEAHGPAFNDHNPIRSGVSRLLFSGRPAAVLFAIGTIVIPTIERMLLRRPLSHVSEEGLEFLPSLADGNAAAAISVIVGTLGLFAAASHVYPDSIFDGALHAVGSSPRPCNARSRFSRETPATLRGPAPNIVRDYKALGSAIASTQDLCPMYAEHSPSIEFFADHDIETLCSGN